MKVALLYGIAVLSVVAAGACSSDDAADDGDTAVDVQVNVDVVDTSPPDTVGSVCTPERRYCLSPTEAGVCNLDGTGATSTETCAGASACEPSTGLCRPTICGPDQIDCLSLHEFQVCEPDGSAWTAEVMSCAPDQVCVDDLCRTCGADKVECLSQKSFRQCASDSQSWSAEQSCPTDFWCIQNECVDCDLSVECINAGRMRRFCANPLIDFEETLDCGAGQACQAGTGCFACDPGATECLDDTNQQTCLNDGSAWGEPQPCGLGEICLDDGCITYACVPKVLLVVDKSGSMGSHWDDVQASIEALVDGNPSIRFGLMTFPTGGFSCDVDGSLAVDFAPDNGPVLSQWFDDNGPTGATPMAAAMSALSANAEDIFGNFGGSVVVLSDGQDTCFSGDMIRVSLAVDTAGLFLDHDITTYAIGYSFSGDVGELDTIANNGGSGISTHIPAGDESELTAAFSTIIDDLKLCDDL